MEGGVVKDLRVAVCSTRRADIDDDARLLVLYAEIGRCGTDEFEGCCVVDGDHRVPLFIGHLSILLERVLLPDFEEEARPCG